MFVVSERIDDHRKGTEEMQVECVWSEQQRKVLDFGQPVFVTSGNPGEWAGERKCAGVCRLVCDSHGQ